jgi:hypothetical protein
MAQQKATLEGLTRKSRRLVNQFSFTNPVVVNGKISASVNDRDRAKFEEAAAEMNLEVVEARPAGKSARGWQDRLKLAPKGN